MPHLKEDDRKRVSSMLAHGCKCREIAEEIGCDPTTISKEVRKNRVVSRDLSKGRKKSMCTRLDRWPHVCGACGHKYTDCCFVQYRYDPLIAQRMYERRLRESRTGIDLTEEECTALVDAVREGLSSKRSVYSSVIASKVDVSVSTVYRYIEEKKIPISKMGLPYAVTYKKRKHKAKEYEYPGNGKIDRNNRTYVDYLAYRKAHINEITLQMDFLGAIKSDSRSILTLILPELHFVMLYTVEMRSAAKVVAVFDSLERALGREKFSEAFPSILTDRDPCFSDIQGIEFSKDTGERRTLLFFCDAFKSNQKASVENMNRQIRKFFPKGKSVDAYTQEQVALFARSMNESPLHSLDGHTPREAFEALFGAEAYAKIFGE